MLSRRPRRKLWYASSRSCLDAWAVPDLPPMLCEHAAWPYHVPPLWLHGGTLTHLMLFLRLLTDIPTPQAQTTHAYRHSAQACTITSRLVNIYGVIRSWRAQEL